jgi:TolB protein
MIKDNHPYLVLETARQAAQLIPSANPTFRVRVHGENLCLFISSASAKCSRAMTMRWSFLLTFSLGLCSLWPLDPARAQQEPGVITVRKSAAQIDLNLPPLSGPDGPAATKTLSDDLSLAAAFNLGAGAGAAYSVRGTAGGGGIQGQLVDRSGAALLNKTYSGGARSAAHQFADDIVLALTKTRGIAGSRIAFIGTRTGHKEVYTCDIDGGNLKQVTSDGNISVGPALSPDGRRLAYTGYKSGYADVYVVDLASGARDRVVKFPGTNTGAAFSPDGSHLALSCSKDGNPELYVTGAGGGGAHRLTRTPGVESSPTWSPDGAEIIYVSDAGGQPQLYRISADGGSGRRLGAGFGYCTEPNWSPDGKRVAFNVRGGGGFEVAVLELGSGTARVVVAGDAQDPVWAADSRHLLYSDASSLYLLDVPTGKKTRVIGGVGKVSEPAISR